MRVPDIRKGDQVLVLSGKEAGKKGTVEHVVRNRQSFKKHITKYGSNWRRISPLADVAVVIEGMNIAKRNTKPRRSMSQNDRAPQVQQGGIVDKPMPLDVSNVMIVCPRCDRPTRVKHQPLSSGKSARVCGHCNEQLEVGA